MILQHTTKARTLASVTSSTAHAAGYSEVQKFATIIRITGSKHSLIESGIHFPNSAFLEYSLCLRQKLAASLLDISLGNHRGAFSLATVNVAPALVDPVVTAEAVLATLDEAILVTFDKIYKFQNELVITITSRPNFENYMRKHSI